MKNIKDTIMSQYANSPAILTLISDINDVIDPKYFVDDFYNLVYRLSTAKGFALDIWADKVGVSRNSPMSDPQGKYWGFNPDFEPFNTYPFSAGIGGTASYTLPDSLLRQLIIFKAYLNIIYATAFNINKFLQAVFKGRAYFKITGRMEAQYVFEFSLTPFERLLVYTLNMLPQPCGVGISIIEDDMKNRFGFDGSELQNFDNGVFA